MKQRSPLRTVMIVVAKILTLTFLLFVISAFAARFVPASGEQVVPDGSFFALLFGIFFAQTVALAYPILRSRWSGWRLVGVVFLAYWGLGTFLTQMETFIYLGDQVSPEMQRGIWLMGTVTAAVFSPIAVWVLGGWRRRPTPPTTPKPVPLGAGQWVFRVGVLAAVFVALYYLFGYFVAWQEPALREYYGGSDPGSFLGQLRSVVTQTPWMLPLQFLRGVLWVAIAIPVVRMMKGAAWWEPGLALALLFTMPSIYLLLPNPLMPESVARAHLVETVPYQFLFGWIVAWLLRRPPANADLRDESAGRRDDPTPEAVR